MWYIIKIFHVLIFVSQVTHNFFNFDTQYSDIECTVTVTYSDHTEHISIKGGPMPLFKPAWFLEIVSVWTSVCVCVCVCVRPQGY